MFLVMLLFWGVLIALAVWLVKVLFDRRSQQPADHVLSAREILAQRYARGEISRAEYDQMLTDLNA